jgi:CheY-like chemotaxis protein
MGMAIGGIGHIMMVDDEDDYHLITRLMLKKAGYAGKLTAFLSPDEALDHLRGNPERPDLLLVDINMPATSGFEFLEDCQRDTLLSCEDTTVVMCSSSNRPIDMDKARALTCVRDYVEKPLSVEEFERIANDHARRASA